MNLILQNHLATKGQPMSEQDPKLVEFDELSRRWVTLNLDESDRQLVLLALAVLSLDSPGFDDAINRIAVRIDNVENGRGQMYDDFRRYRRPS
jgi:hypothetical protein